LQSVYFLGATSGTGLWELHGTPSKKVSEAGWQSVNLKGGAAGNPSEAYSSENATTPVNLYYFNEAGGITTMYSEGGSWKTTEVCGWSCLVQTPPSPANTAAPQLSTTSPKVGVALTTSSGTWTKSPTSYAYRWERCNTSGIECTNISGATSSNYTPMQA